MKRSLRRKSFKSNLLQVARPVDVTPITLVASADQIKCSDHYPD